MELIIINNNGRCFRCCYSEKKDLPKNNYPLLDINDYQTKCWQWCHKYGRYCKGIAGHCKAPNEGYKNE